MKLLDRVFALREGGQVKRTHTMEYSGPYNVAIHSYNAINLLLLLYPEQPSLNLIKAVLWHDVPERWTGDVPAPAKWAVPELKIILDQLEERILKKFDLYVELTPEEKSWLKGVDSLELWLWGIEQAKLGNVCAHGIVDRVFKAMSKNWDNVPKEVRDFILSFEWKRTDECNEILEG